MTEHPLTKPPLGRLQRLLSLLADPVRTMSLIEQGLLSIANFLALLLLGRHLQSSEYGTFAFAYLSVLFVVNLHRSVIVVPFVIHTAAPDKLAAEGRSWAKLNNFTTLCGAVALALVSIGAALLDAPRWMVWAFVATALLLGPVFWYEFLRRWAIQRGGYRQAVRAAIAYLAVYMAGAALAARTESLSAALAAYGAANLAAAFVCLPAVREVTLAPAQSLRSFIAGHRGFLGWSFLSNLAYNGYGHLPPLILGAMLGPEPVAIFQALRNFSQPLGTLATAIDNFDKPRAARALVSEGVSGMRRQLARTTTALWLFGGPFMLVMLVFHQPLVDLVYATRYADHASDLMFWVALAVANNVAYPFETALLLVRRADLLFRGRLMAAVAAILFTLATVGLLGVPAAMLGLTLGSVVAGLFGYVYLGRITRAGAPAPGAA